ncbi:MAG: TolC family protein [Bdellovibrionia bacterium]
MRKFLAVFLLTIFSSPALSAFAADSSAKTIVLDPATLRAQLLKGNLSLVQQEKLVEDAKTSISVARAGLFPSLNLSAAFKGNFILSSIDFLVPFLIPSNWAELDQNKHLFEAQKLSYKALELNTYSSALSVYFNVRSDNEIAQQHLQQAKDLRQIADYIQNAASFGVASGQDVQNALGNAEAAEGEASKMQVAMIKELAALRQMLGLSLDTQILFSTDQSAATLAPSTVESATSPTDIAKAVDRSLSTGPELAQINELITAAKAGTWSKAFGWINSASLEASSENGSNASFSNLQARGSVSLGLGIFPVIELSHRNVQEIQLRAEALRQENTEILEGSILATQEAQNELAHFSRAEAALKGAYDDVLTQYQFGVANIYDVLQAHQSLSAAAINRIQAELEITLLRVTLHRTMLTDEFAKIPDCAAQNPPAPQKRGGFFGNLFGSHKDESGPSLLEICRAK